jgi:hypothetical protein
VSIIARDLQPGDQFINEKNGAVTYTLVSEVPAPFVDEISFRITPPQAEGENIKTWRRDAETPLVRPT